MRIVVEIPAQIPPALAKSIIEENLKINSGVICTVNFLKRVKNGYDAEIISNELKAFLLAGMTLAQMIAKIKSN